MRTKRWFAAAAAVAVTIGATGCGGDDSASAGGGDGPVAIASIEDLTGPIGPYGKAILNGTQLAIDEANAAGGVLGGRQVELRSEDAASDKATVPSLLRKVSGAGATAVIGPTSSSALVLAAPVAKQLETVLVAPSSSEEFKDDVLNDWTFRVAPTEAGAFTELFGQMQKRLGFKRVALFYDEANNASLSERRLLEENQQKLGYELVAAEASPEGRTDVSGVVSKIAGAKPDVIFVSHLVPESAAFLKQVRARGVDADFVGGAQFATTQIFDIAGKAAEGALTFVPYIASSDKPEVQAFNTAYEAKFKTAPDQFAALGYDTGKVVLAAIEQAGSTDRKAVRDALAQLKPVEGVTGTISYQGGPDNATPELVLVQVEDGKLVPVESAPEQ
jgi:branched-chain amino acid transport system substrate-binding protein